MSDFDDRRPPGEHPLPSLRLVGSRRCNPRLRLAPPLGDDGAPDGPPRPSRPVAGGGAAVPPADAPLRLVPPLPPPDDPPRGAA